MKRKLSFFFLLYLFSQFWSLVNSQDLSQQKPLTIVYDSIVGADLNLLSLDIYQANVEVPSPVVIFVHGGGWCGGDKSGSKEKAEFFSCMGYVFISINYRLSPTLKREPQPPLVPDFPPDAVRHPTHVNDVAKAISWIYHNIASYGGDPNNMVLMGHSAGGHLAMLVTLDARYLEFENLSPSVLKATIDLDAGTLDIPARYDTVVTAYPFFASCINNAFGTDRADWEEASPMNYIKKGIKIPKILLVYQQEHAERKKEHERAYSLLVDYGHEASILGVELNHSEINQYIGPKEKLPVKDLKKLEQAMLLTSTIDAFLKEVFMEKYSTSSLIYAPLFQILLD